MVRYFQSENFILKACSSNETNVEFLRLKHSQLQYIYVLLKDNILSLGL